MCFASVVSSCAVVCPDELEVSGGKPDLDSSPEVFTWTRMLRGSAREEGRALFSAVAALEDVRVWMAYRFGIATPRFSDSRFCCNRGDTTC